MSATFNGANAARPNAEMIRLYRLVREATGVKNMRVYEGYWYMTAPNGLPLLLGKTKRQAVRKLREMFVELRDLAMEVQDGEERVDDPAYAA